MLKRPLSGVGLTRQHWLLVICAVVISLLSLFRLGTSPNGISPADKGYVASTQKIKTIYESPANGPHKLAVYGAAKVFKSNPAYLRLVSVIFGLVFAASFYILCLHWFGRTVALMSLVMFALSSFFLISARQIAPEIMRFAPLLILTVYYWLNRTPKKDVAWILLLLVAGAAFYIPGIFWWLASAAIVCRRPLMAMAGKISQPAAAAGLLIFALVVAPIVMAFVRDWHFVYQYLMIPSQLPQPLDFLKHLAWMTLSLFIKTPFHDQLIIGRLPLVSIIQLTLILFGVYALFSAATKKARWLATTVIYSVLLAALNNDIKILLLGLPALAIFMAAGTRYLYIEWRSVFPKNPLPKALAIILLSAMVAVQSVYGLTYSLVAWPAAKDTKTTYVLK